MHIADDPNISILIQLMLIFIVIPLNSLEIVRTSLTTIFLENIYTYTSQNIFYAQM